MTNLYTSLVSGVIFPLHEHLKGHDSVARRRELERSQWLSRPDLDRLQAARLRAFLAQIGARVPYYREMFRRTGFDPAAVASVADLQQLPLLTKAEVRANVEALKADGHGPLKRYNTGGSSGEPLIFFMGLDRISHDVAAKWRATRWWGVDIGDPEIVVWGSPIEHGTQDRVKDIRDHLLRSRLLPAFEMSPEKVGGFIESIRRARPRMLFGYPSALAFIARAAAAAGQRMDDLGIRVAFVTSEKLYDDQREAIARVFGCPVANGYGGRDAGFLAHECPAGGMHLSAEDIVVETVDDAGRPVAPGTAGEIVVTHMATGEFPFVRYRTGDVGVLDAGACSCGRGLPLLKEIQGRSTDFVIARNGTVMHGLALIYVVRDLPAVSQFRIVQESLEHTRVEVVPGAGFGDADRVAIQAGLGARLGAGVRVDVETVAAIAPEASGKYRYVVSRVAPGASAP